jgi:3D (Asp-Asp-Asp) domain-containing protein
MNLRKSRKIVLLLVAVVWCVSPNLAFASAISSAESSTPQILGVSADDTDPGSSGGVSDLKTPALNIKPQYSVVSTSNHVATAYTSEASQTDSDPCTTATGFNLCQHGIEDSVAANFLPMGTKVRFPDLFGDHVFTVRDRMNARFSNRIDIWFKDKKDALNFGIQRVKIEIVEENK